MPRIPQLDPEINATPDDLMVVYDNTTDETRRISLHAAFTAGAAGADATFDEPGLSRQIVYNVKDYGAVGNGTTDDSGAIQDAIDAAITGNDGTVYFPPGTYALETSIDKDASNIHLQGAGVGQTTIKNTAMASGATMFDLGNTAGPTARENITVQDMTFDLNSKRCWGLSVGWTSRVRIRNCAFINPKATPSGSLSMVFVGLFSNQADTWDANDILIEDCVFDYGGVDNPWEAVTLGYVRNATVRGCTFLNKPGNVAALLNYNSEEVTMVDCYAYRCRTQFGGRGPFHILNNKFESSQLFLWAADNVTVKGNSFLGTEDDPGASRNVGISLQGNYFDTFEAGEVPFYLEDAVFPYTWNCKNILIEGNNFSYCNSYAISTDTTTFDGTPVLDTDNISIIGNVIENTYSEGLHVFVNYAIITGNRILNSGQSGTASTLENGFIAAKYGILTNNQSYDNQGSPTVVRDFVLTNELVASFITTQAWYISNNNLNVTGSHSYYNAGFTTTKPAAITVTASSGDFVGPSSSTDNAVVRFDSTTGKLGQNSGVTINDNNGISATVANSGNTANLTLTQNDTTNNPRVMDITNAGTGISMNVAQNGNGKAIVIADAGTSRSLEINKNNTGPAVIVTRNQNNGSSAMTTFTQSNASDPQDAFQITNAGTGSALLITQTGTGKPLTITHNPASNNALASQIVNGTQTITGGVTDGYHAGVRLTPTYSAATAQTVTRHNYLDINDVTLAGGGPAAVTNAAVLRFNAAAGTHKAVDSGSTKTTPGGVDAWIKVNINGTLYYMPAYTSKTT